MTFRKLVLGIEMAVAIPLFGESTVQIRWGVLPFVDESRNSNGTLLMDGNSEWTPSAFNTSNFLVRLAEVGDGSFDEAKGFAKVSWIDSASAEDASTRWKNVELDGNFTVYGDTLVPVKLFGDFDAEPEEVQEEYFWSDEDYYTEKWQANKFALLVYDRSNKTAYRFSDTVGGTNMPECVFSGYDGEIVLEYDVMAPWRSQQPFNLVASTESKRIYLGAEIPQRCVWMADKGLTEEDLEGVDEETVDLAIALDSLPADVAGGVELKIGSITLGEGTADISWNFAAVDSSGAAKAVSSLRGGARLLLETASSVDDLGTAASDKRALDLSGTSISIPTAGERFFARLVLEKQ